MPSSPSERTFVRCTALTEHIEDDKIIWQQPSVAGLASSSTDTLRRTGCGPLSPRQVGGSKKVSFALRVLFAHGVGAFDSLQAIPSAFVGILIPFLMLRHNAGALGRLELSGTTGVRKSGSSSKILKQNHSAEPSHLAHSFGRAAGILTAGVGPLRLLRTGPNPAHSRRP